MTMVWVVFVWMFIQTFHSILSADWPLKKRSFIDGDFVLGGFFPIHGRDNERVCGPLHDEGLIELEAMLFTVDRINENSSILPGIKLGVLAVDSCDSVPKALEEAVDFAKGFIVRDDGSTMTEDSGNFSSMFMCDGREPFKYESGMFDKVAAIIGGHSSWVSMQVADMMRIYKMPQVSYHSTNPALSDQGRFGYFFRTVPPLDHQVRAILQILKEFKWTYVSVVYADSEYGNRGFEFLKSEAPLQQICFSSQQRINVENSKEKDYDFFLSNLLKRNATAVIVLGDHEMARHLISAATRAHAFDRFVWIGSTAWVSRDYVTSENELTMEGAIGISYDIRPLEQFDDYLKTRNLNIHKKINPWFPEYWEKKMKCRLKTFDKTPFNQNYTVTCSTDAQLTFDRYSRSAPAVQFVRDAVYAVAYALHNLRTKKCRRRRGCSEFKSTGEELKKYLSKVEFEDENQNPFRFNEKGDGPPRYSVVNFQRMGDSNEYAWVSVGTYQLLQVCKLNLTSIGNGSYNCSTDDTGTHCDVTCLGQPVKRGFHCDRQGNWNTPLPECVEPDGNAPPVPFLHLHRERIKYHHNKTSFPESLCSAPCKDGQAMIVLDEAKCCWHCANCTEFQFVEEGSRCKECPQGTAPSFTKDSCKPIAVHYMDFSNPWAAGCIFFSVFGIVMSLGVGAVYWKFCNTPVFTVSGRELSAILLVGIQLMFSLTFIIVSKPSDFSCAVVRFFLGFYYTVSYATIAAKTRHLSRLCQQLQRVNKKPKKIKAKSLLLVVFALITVEGTINATWLIHSPPTTDHQYPSRQENVFICKGSNTAGYLVGLVYPFLLMVFCTFYALRIRDFTGAFYESRYINFTNYTTCVVWLAFLPMFLLNNRNFLRVVVLSLLLNLSALVQLVCLFFPKVYIALRRPEKNRHENIICHDVPKSTSTGT